MSEDRNLATMLKEIMMLSDKYDFNIEDRLTLMDRMLLLGEACAFLEELGLRKELNDKHAKACKYAEELLNRI